MVAATQDIARWGGRRLAAATMLLRTLGVLFIAAAWLKAYAGLTDPFGGFSPWSRAQVLFEFAVGVWGLTTHRLRIARWALIGLFVLFAVVALHGLSTGAGSCGCLGRFSPPPGFTLAFDIAAITGLLCLGSPLERTPPMATDRPRRTVLSVCILAVAAAAWLLDQASASAPHSQAGESTQGDIDGLPAEVQLDFGYVAPGSTVVRVLQLPAPQTDLKVTDIVSECDCLRPLDPPGTLPAASTTPMHVQLVAPAEQALYAKRLRLTFDSQGTRRLDVIAKARIGVPLEIVPDELTVDPGRDERPKIGVINHSPDPVRLLYATTNLASVYVRIPQGETAVVAGRQPAKSRSEDASRVNLEVGWQDKAPSAGESVAVTIHTDQPGQPTIRTRIRFAAAGLAERTESPAP